MDVSNPLKIVCIGIDPDPYPKLTRTQTHQHWVAETIRLLVGLPHKLYHTWHWTYSTPLVWWMGTLLRLFSFYPLRDGKVQHGPWNGEPQILGTSQLIFPLPKIPSFCLSGFMAGKIGCFSVMGKSSRDWYDCCVFHSRVRLLEVANPETYSDLG